MHYFPILNTPYAYGITTVFNFSPRNISGRHQTPAFIYLTWTNGIKWQYKCLSSIEYGTHFSFDYLSALNLIGDSVQPFLFLSSSELPFDSACLPFPAANDLSPAWRASVSLKSYSSVNTASYQGEMPIFRPHSSFLSFSSLAQCNKNIQNDLLFVNLESSPSLHEHNLFIFDASKPNNPLDCLNVSTNSSNFINLDQYIVDSKLLLGFSCPSMSGVPLFISYQSSTTRLTMEHTHPPASLFIHGNRFHAQKLIKESWELYTSKFSS